MFPNSTTKINWQWPRQWHPRRICLWLKSHCWRVPPSCLRSFSPKLSCAKKKSMLNILVVFLSNWYDFVVTTRFMKRWLGQCPSCARSWFILAFASRGSPYSSEPSLCCAKNMASITLQISFMDAGTLSRDKDASIEFLSISVLLLLNNNCKMRRWLLVKHWIGLVLEGMRCFLILEEKWSSNLTRNNRHHGRVVIELLRKELKVKSDHPAEEYKLDEVWYNWEVKIGMSCVVLCCVVLCCGVVWCVVLCVVGSSQLNSLL